MTVIDVTEEKLNQEVSEGLKLVDLWAPWCGSCKMISPTVEDVAKDYSEDMDVLKVNIDEEQDVASNLGVMSIPTLVLFKDGERVDSLTGFQPKEVIDKMIQDNLN